MYKTIKKILTTRDAVLVKNKKRKDRKYCLITRCKDPIGGFRNSGWCYRKEDCEYYFGSDHGFRNKKVYEDLEIIKPLDIPKETFKEGDEVVVTEGEHKGKIGQINRVEDGFKYKVELDDEAYEKLLYHNQLSYPFTKPKEEKKERIFSTYDPASGDDKSICMVWELKNGKNKLLKIIDKPEDHIEIGGKKYKLKEIK